ncbi:NlpC/P60 family protein [Streptomyces sp. NRRL F-5126]|uniref:C40 family peptidase n=1 Tax=Streptomyces sp. NRRL F-5126 TaxID=1463857 RepID=UPI003B632F82
MSAEGPVPSGHAAPARHRRQGPGAGGRAGAVIALSAAAASAAAALGAAPADAQPAATPAATRARVDALYEQAERATQSYDAATERVATLTDRVRSTQSDAARGQARINTMRGALGSVVGAQYRSGGIDPSLALLLTSDPDTYLERATFLDRIGEHDSGTLHRLRQAQRGLDQERATAAHELAQLKQSRAAVARHKHTVEAKLAEARHLLAALPAADRAPYGRASRGSGRLGDLGDVFGAEGGGASPASSRAAAALAAARSALGKPYAWGAEGPNSFDCSGLMQWAYAQAGVALPRTSQAQRYAGRRIPLSEARPGDLVTYRADASHIAMYAGHGQVIHAPYPGASVRYDPVGMLPVNSVTRV